MTDIRVRWAGPTVTIRAEAGNAVQAAAAWLPTYPPFSLTAYLPACIIIVPALDNVLTYQKKKKERKKEGGGVDRQ